MEEDAEKGVGKKKTTKNGAKNRKYGTTDKGE